MGSWQNKVICAIDGGMEGAFCVMDRKHNILAFDVMPTIGKQIDAHEVARLFTEYRDKYNCEKFVIEKVGTRPRQSAQSGVSSGRNYGMIIGIMASLKLPFEEISSQKWSKKLPTVSKSHPNQSLYKLRKIRNLRCAKQLYPDIDLTKSDRAKAPHGGKVDALLIADFVVGEL